MRGLAGVLLRTFSPSLSIMLHRLPSTPCALMLLAYLPSPTDESPSATSAAFMLASILAAPAFEPPAEQPVKGMPTDPLPSWWDAAAGRT